MFRCNLYDSTKPFSLEFKFVDLHDNWYQNRKKYKKNITRNNMITEVFHIYASETIYIFLTPN